MRFRPHPKWISVGMLTGALLSIAWTGSSCTGTLSTLYVASVVLAPAHINTPYQSYIVVTGGVAPYTYVISSGSLPPGLYLDPLTGRIYGVPSSPGAYTFICRIYDSRFPPFWAERTFVITVTPI